MYILSFLYEWLNCLQKNFKYVAQCSEASFAIIFAQLRKKFTNMHIHE